MKVFVDIYAVRHYSSLRNLPDLVALPTRLVGGPPLLCGCSQIPPGRTSTNISRGTGYHPCAFYTGATRTSSACCRHVSASTLPIRFHGGLAYALSSAQFNCHWVWSPTDKLPQLAGQPPGKQVHLRRAQPLIDLPEDCWAQFPIFLIRANRYSFQNGFSSCNTHRL